jgi:1-acyl-sn-glycerol-3-phosphate acyltransferase
MSAFAPPPGPFVRIVRAVLFKANRVFCRVMFRLTTPTAPPLPPSGPVILVCNHSSLTDPLTLFATANRPIRFLMAREYYARHSLQWLFRLAGSIPVSRDRVEPGAVRKMLNVLAEGEVLGIFPEGGIVQHRKEEGYRGVGYLAIKSGAPVIPAAITWERPRPLNLLRALTQPARAAVRYSAPLVFSQTADESQNAAREATDRILQAIRELGSQ